MKSLCESCKHLLKIEIEPLYQQQAPIERVLCQIDPSLYNSYTHVSWDSDGYSIQEILQTLKIIKCSHFEEAMS